MRAGILPFAALTVASCAYQPGAFSHRDKSFPGQRTTLGCLDLAIHRRAQVELDGAVLSYEFGNRCAHPATVDLANVRVLAQTASGTRVSLHAYDPSWEIRPLRIDGRVTGAEAIEYRSDEPLVTICVDAASIVNGPTAEWHCFSSEPPPSVAEVSR